MLDDDLKNYTTEQLMAEILLLRNGIREHRDSTRHELCWHHPKLWNLLPEKTDPKIEVPDWLDFIKGCIRYRSSLDKNSTPEVTNAESTENTSTRKNNFSGE